MHIRSLVLIYLILNNIALFDQTERYSVCKVALTAVWEFQGQRVSYLHRGLHYLHESYYSSALKTVSCVTSFLLFVNFEICFTVVYKGWASIRD